MGIAASERRVIGEVGKYIEDAVLPKLYSHTDILKDHTKALKRIEVNTRSNRDNITRLDKRVTRVEGQLGIVPQPELTIVRYSSLIKFPEVIY